MRVALFAGLVLLAGCTSDSPPADPSAPDAPERGLTTDLGAAGPEAVPTSAQPLPQPCCFTTTVEKIDFGTPSFSVASNSFMDWAEMLRTGPPDALDGTLVEARYTPESPALGGYALAIYGGPSEGNLPLSESGKEIGRAEAPDEDGIYRVWLSADAWGVGELWAHTYSNGTGASLIGEAHVDLWTTTFEGMAMPAGFTAVQPKES